MKVLAEKILLWYQQNKRQLPWREDANPFKIWLSEIILQQTRIDQGTAYYLKFTDRFSTVHDLANAEEEEVLKLWQGLGYYSRARNLLFAAKQVVNEHDGVFPDSAEGLRNLKGIGPYTAAAIASIAYNEAIPVVDGNVLRVISRLIGMEDAINSAKGEKKVRETMTRILPRSHPGDFNQSVMELGALVCKPQKPLCNTCPWENDCQARRDRSFDRIPFKEKKTKTKEVHTYYVVLKHGDELLVRKRPAKGIWANMYDFPSIEHSKAIVEEEAITQLQSALGKSFIVTHISESFKHILSHRKIQARFIIASTDQKIAPKKDESWVAKGAFDNLPIPRLIDKAQDLFWTS
ncbi:MAG: A/G-specific adenine glycosylase [Flavobacteriales bacterium]|nr:A/G-specific adenine glycosylase [Flavobacteriales bacterium]